MFRNVEHKFVENCMLEEKQDFCQPEQHVHILQKSCTGFCGREKSPALEGVLLHMLWVAPFPKELD